MGFRATLPDHIEVIGGKAAMEIDMNTLMGLAGIICGGLMWYAIIKNS
jgi:hypothetical protein